jgi:hypothetical protein
MLAGELAGNEAIKDGWAGRAQVGVEGDDGGSKWRVRNGCLLAGCLGVACLCR